jgi:hypothetical protein
MLCLSLYGRFIRAVTNITIHPPQTRKADIAPVVFGQNLPLKSTM